MLRKDYRGIGEEGKFQYLFRKTLTRIEILTGRSWLGRRRKKMKIKEGVNGL